jgi:hypothetical protein
MAVLHNDHMGTGGLQVRDETEGHLGKDANSGWERVFARSHWYNGDHKG